MTDVREDNALVLPEPPGAIPPLGLEPGGLAIARPAGPGALLAEGSRTAIVGSQRGPIDRVLIDGRVVVERLSPTPGSVANVVSFPGLVLRECVGATGVSFESALATPTLPLVAVQWRHGDAGAPVTISLELPLTGDAAYRVGAGSCAVVDGDGRMVGVGVSPGAADIEVDRNAPTHLTVRIRAAPADVTTLLVAAGTPVEVGRAFGAARHLGGYARLARESPLDDGLVLSTGVTEVDEGVHWARSRLAAALSRAAADPRALGVGAFWAAVAALAIADERALADGYRALDEVDALLASVIAGGMATTLDQPREALRRANALLDGTLTLGGAAMGSSETGWHRTAIESLTRGLLNTAPAKRIEELTRASRAGDGSALPAGPSGGHRKGVRLPVVGQAPAGPTVASWLPSLLAGEPASPSPQGRSEGEAAICSLAALFRADPDAAWRDWRERIGAGLSDGPAGPGSWDHVEGGGGLVAPATAALLIGLAHGLLGMSPDAPSGRIRLAPRLPSHLTAFAVGGVTVGQTRLSLAYERDGAAHLFTLEPTGGSVPCTAVFEPSVPGRVAEVRVDGALAELETRHEGGRSVVPVQLPVDATRSVEIVTE